MILIGQNNIRNELYMSELVDLDVLHLFLNLKWPGYGHGLQNSKMTLTMTF